MSEVSVELCRVKPPLINVAEEIPWLAGRERETILLHPYPDAELPRAASKIGGAFLWPATRPWPVCPAHHSPYVGILQLWRNDIPALPCPLGTDLLQLLWCPFDHPIGYSLIPQPSMVWHTRQELNNLLAAIPSPHPNAERFYLPTQCRVCPEPVLEYPSIMELLPEEVASLNNWEPRAVSLQDAVTFGPEKEYGWYRPDVTGAILYQAQLSTAPGTKIGGYAPWIQEPAVPRCACGNSMRYVLSIPSYEFADADFPRWTPLGLAYPPKPISAYQTAQSPTGLELGGRLYLFVCTQHAVWETGVVFQR